MSRQRLFTFCLPGCPDTRFALTQPEVLAVEPCPQTLTVPFAPVHISGLGVWRGQPLTLFDLAGCVVREQRLPAFGVDTMPKVVIARALAAGEQVRIAWPIAPDAVAITLPDNVPVVSPPPSLNPVMIRHTVMDSGELNLLHLDRLLAGDG